MRNCKEHEESTAMGEGRERVGEERGRRTHREKGEKQRQTERETDRDKERDNIHDQRNLHTQIPTSEDFNQPKSAASSKAFILYQWVGKVEPFVRYTICNTKQSAW